MEQLQEHLGQALRHCIENGMKLPLIVCVVSANGSLLVIRMNEGLEPDELARHFENDTFTSPINIMVVDRQGEAERVVIEGREISYQ